MNSSADSQNACSSSSHKKKAGDEESLQVIPSKRARFLQTYRRQLFALPDSIMHYIAKNPSTPEMYAKMVQTCKYFFIKNPILIISDLLYHNGWYANIHDHKGWNARKNEETKNIDFKKVLSKLWLTGQLRVSFVNELQHHLASSLITKIYKCDITNLILNYQHIYYNELMILATKVEHVEFHQVIVKHRDGSIVPFEKVFEAFPFVKCISFSAPSNVTAFTAKTFIELSKIPQFSTLEHCMLHNIPDNFDLESFYVYIKKNKRTKFHCSFSDSISDAYQIRLEEIVDEILDIQNHTYKLPFINFSGLSNTKYIKFLLLSNSQ